MTRCKNCGHESAVHNSPDAGFGLACSICDDCPGYAPDVCADGHSQYCEHRDPPRRCEARHGQRTTVQCERMETEATVHDGPHRAEADGDPLFWLDLVAVYPPAGEPVANPSRTVISGGPSAHDSQVGGDHYRKFKIQPWDVIDEYGLGFYAGSVLKYLLRAGRKGAILEDLKKCRHYLDKLIETEEARE